MWAIAAHKDYSSGKTLGYTIMDEGSGRCVKMSINDVLSFHTPILNLKKLGRDVKLLNMNPSKRKVHYRETFDETGTVIIKHLCIITNIENSLIDYIASLPNEGASSGQSVSLTNIISALGIDIKDLRLYNGYLAENEGSSESRGTDKYTLFIYNPSLKSYTKIPTMHHKYTKSKENRESKECKECKECKEWEQTIIRIDTQGTHVKELKHTTPVQKETIPSDIATLQHFKGNVKNLKLGESLLSIEENCFRGLTDIHSIDFGSIQEIPYGCCRESSIEAVKFSFRTHTICAGAFMDCKNLTGALVTKASNIYDAAFMNTGIKSIKLINIEELGKESFKNCTKLQKLILDNPNLRVMPSKAFENCTRLAEIKIAAGQIKSIERWAFRNCKSLKEISIPESVEIIKSQAFEGCSSLRKVYVSSKRTMIESNAFPTGVDIQFMCGV